MFANTRKTRQPLARHRINVGFTGWQFHNGRYEQIFSVIEIGKMSLKRPL